MKSLIKPIYNAFEIPITNRRMFVKNGINPVTKIVEINIRRDEVITYNPMFFYSQENSFKWYGILTNIDDNLENNKVYLKLVKCKDERDNFVKEYEIEGFTTTEYLYYLLYIKYDKRRILLYFV